MPQRTATLTRQIRFALREPARDIASNSFAAHPPVFGIEPFLTLTAHLTGNIDQQTGMLINIAEIDAVLRDVGIPHLRKFHLDNPTGSAPAPTLWAEVSLLRQCLQDAWPKLALERLALHLTPLFHVTALRSKESNNMPTVLVSQRFEFAASHRLYTTALSPEENLRLFGRCTNANGHGHNYELEISLNVPVPSPERNVIAALQNTVKAAIIDRFDHKHLNLDCPEFAALNPTVENIAQIIFDLLADQFPAPLSLAKVRVWETPKTSAEVTADSRRATE